MELDLAQQLVRVHDGGYEAYLVERDAARRAREEYEEYAARRSASRRGHDAAQLDGQGVRTRSKSKDGDKHIKGSTALPVGEAGGQGQARPERTSVSRTWRICAEWELRLEIATAPRAGAVVATLRGAVVGAGGFRLGPLDLQIDWGDRAAITGANGGRGSPPCSPPSWGG